MPATGRFSTTRWRWSVKGGAFSTDFVGEYRHRLGHAVDVDPFGDQQLGRRRIAGHRWRSQAGVARRCRQGRDHDGPVRNGRLAGTLIANRGWILTDRPVGLFDHARLPDLEYVTGQRYFDPFKEIDDRPGWYAGTTWHREGMGTLSLLRYDNQANPSAFRQQFAWHTAFWSAGAEADFDKFVLLSQAMAGETEIDPAPGNRNRTRFQAAYLLAGYGLDNWRVATRPPFWHHRQLRRDRLPRW